MSSPSDSRASSLVEKLQRIHGLTRVRPEDAVPQRAQNTSTETIPPSDNTTASVTSAAQPSPNVLPTFFTTASRSVRSVARPPNGIDTLALFRPEDVMPASTHTDINFEQDFREWFNPDDLYMSTSLPANYLDQIPNPHESNLNAELSRLPTITLNSVRQELGLHDKDLQSLTVEDKSRMVNFARQRGANLGRKPAPGGPQRSANLRGSNSFTTAFMQSAASTLDDFDTQALFRNEGTGINFEQDFREWFNPDDLV